LNYHYIQFALKFHLYFLNIYFIQKSILCSALLIFCLCVKAQNIKPPSKNVIVMYPKQLFLSFVYNSYYTSEDNLYLLGYRRIIGNNIGAVRLGLNFDNNVNNTYAYDTLISNTNSRSKTLGLGFEKYRQITKAWSFNFGLDIYAKQIFSNSYYFYGNSSSISNKDMTSKQVVFDKGLYIYSGCIVALNSRISLGLETGFKMAIQNTSYSEILNYKNSPPKIYSNNSTNNNTTFIYPNIDFRVRL
jgi:hypothetical protein